jgi:secreted protein with Ig-like and vWFA domain
MTLAVPEQEFVAALKMEATAAPPPPQSPIMAMREMGGAGRAGVDGTRNTAVPMANSNPMAMPAEDGVAKRDTALLVGGRFADIIDPADAPVMPMEAEMKALNEANCLKFIDGYNTEGTEQYKQFTENDFKPLRVGEFSTFSIDVDTASYSTMRRYIERGQRPPEVSVRLEEYLNYFKYDYAQPKDDKPFATHVDVFQCPWEPKHLLARIGIKGKEYTVDERPPLNLVFLVDVSGSMEPANRLPLIKQGLAELVEMLQPKDRVAIVTYAGDSRLALPSLPGDDKRRILDTINGLTAGGSTNGEGGIKMAYEVARQNYDKEAQNRVILCTDGDFNVGTVNNKTLEEMIGDEAKSGVFLTILGFGMGNTKDDRLKTVSMRGNGNYGYIDNLEECRKLLVEGLSGTLFAIAKDVKIQVDFNPTKVAGYRLLGYENRHLRDADFHNDAVDAGEIGAGHTVTALYEIVPVGIEIPSKVDKSRYESEPNREPPTVSAEFADELMFVKLRYKEPDGDKSSLLEFPVKASVGEMTEDFQFAAAVALYGMLLRSSQHAGSGTWSTVLELATPNTKGDKYRLEFIDLVKKAQVLR